MAALRAVQDPGARGPEGAGRGARREGGPAGVPDRAAVRAAVPEPPAGHVGRRADADDEGRPVHPGAHEAGVPRPEEPQGQERRVGHGDGDEVGVLLDEHAVAHGGQAVRHELWHLAGVRSRGCPTSRTLLRIQSRVVSVVCDVR